MKIEDAIVEKRKEIEKLQDEVDNLEKNSKIYSDLRSHTNRWGHVRYYSKSINADVDEFDSGHNCGCCPDSPLEVWPYKKVDGQKIYSDPPVFIIGDRNSYDCDCDNDCNCEWYTEKAYLSWHKKLKKHGISKVVINKIGDMLVKQAGIDWYPEVED